MKAAVSSQRFLYSHEHETDMTIHTQNDAPQSNPGTPGSDAASGIAANALNASSSLSDYQDLFQLDPDFIHLNHAAVAPWPRATQQAVCQFAQENARQGSWAYPQWLQTEQTVRDQLCRVIGVEDSATIALVKNTSEALSFVAYGLTWQEGDNIVISNQEFPSNRVVWESLKNQGVEVRAADITHCKDVEAALIAQCDNNTRLLSISAVQYASGLKLDLARLGESCRQRNILICVDAIQQAGALPLALQQCDVDFAMADGHKWLLGPEGLGFFYVKPEAMNRLKLTQYGWHMLDKPGDFDNESWQIADTARRFECGSPNMTGVHALHASLAIIEQVGIDTIAARILDNSQFLIQQLQSIPGVSVVTPPSPQRHAGIVSFRSADKDLNALFQRLSQQRIFCALRSNAIRLSPHFYTPRQHLELCLQHIRDFANA